MRKNPRRILSPQRLPFRHPGSGRYKSSGREHLLQHLCVYFRPPFDQCYFHPQSESGASVFQGEPGPGEFSIRVMAKRGNCLQGGLNLD